MTTVPEALATHLAGVATTTCHAWIVRRTDGVVLGFTDHDRVLTVDGVPCEPGTGMTASEVESALGFSSETAEVAGALASTAISADDIVSGRYEGATVDLYVVNWREPGQFALIRRATCGEFTRADGRFTLELRSLQGVLDRPSGRAYLRRCDAELGDPRCGVDLGLPAFRGTGAVTFAEDNIRLTVGGLEGFQDAWFAGGRLEWVSGLNAGVRTTVSHHRGTAITLPQPSPLAIMPGDGFVVYSGCDKSFGTCKAKFSNALRFRGFPHIPGSDAALGYVHADDAYDGRPLVA